MSTEAKRERLERMEQALGVTWSHEQKERMLANMSDSAKPSREPKSRTTDEAFAKLGVSLDNQRLTEAEANAIVRRIDEAETQAVELTMTRAERFEYRLMRLIRSRKPLGLDAQIDAAARFVAEEVCGLTGLTPSDEDVLGVRNAMVRFTPRVVRETAARLIAKPPADMASPVGVLVWRCKGAGRKVS